jgi:hypothetical protein
MAISIVRAAQTGNRRAELIRQREEAWRRQLPAKPKRGCSGCRGRQIKG